jgi:hypothetical protein
MIRVAAGLAAGLAAVAALAVTGAASVLAQAPGQFQPGLETPAALPAGPGRDETFYLCTACHGSAIVTRQGLSRSAWDDVLTLMVERHGMAEPVGEERRIILDYLAGAFPARAQGPAGGWRNPFAN